MVIKVDMTQTKKKNGFVLELRIAKWALKQCNRIFVLLSSSGVVFTRLVFVTTRLFSVKGRIFEGHV